MRKTPYILLAIFLVGCRASLDVQAFRDQTKLQSPRSALVLHPSTTPGDSTVAYRVTHTNNLLVFFTVQDATVSIFSAGPTPEFKATLDRTPFLGYREIITIQRGHGGDLVDMIGIAPSGRVRFVDDNAFRASTRFGEACRQGVKDVLNE